MIATSLHTLCFLSLSGLRRTFRPSDEKSTTQWKTQAAVPTVTRWWADLSPHLLHHLPTTFLPLYKVLHIFLVMFWILSTNRGSKYGEWISASSPLSTEWRRVGCFRSECERCTCSPGLEPLLKITNIYKNIYMYVCHIEWPVESPPPCPPFHNFPSFISVDVQRKWQSIALLEWGSAETALKGWTGSARTFCNKQILYTEGCSPLTALIFDCGVND